MPDHELLVAVNNEDGKAGGLRYLGEAGSFFARGERSQHEEVTYSYMGSDREFPRESELPIEVLRAAAKEFLESGGDRPDSVEWVTD